MQILRVKRFARQAARKRRKKIDTREFFCYKSPNNRIKICPRFFIQRGGGITALGSPATSCGKDAASLGANSGKQFCLQDETSVVKLLCKKCKQCVTKHIHLSNSLFGEVFLFQILETRHIFENVSRL